MQKQIIHTVFERTAAVHPHRIAVEEEARTISYDQLNREANRIAHWLGSQPVREKAVAVIMAPGIGLVSTMLAVFKAGAIYLPVDVRFSPRLLRQVFGQADPVLVVTDGPTASHVFGLLTAHPNRVAQVLVTEAGKDLIAWRRHGQGWQPHPLPAGDLAAHDPAVDIAPDDPNYIFYTSGSSGEAKAILGCHKSLSHFIHWEAGEFALGPACRVSGLTQYTFDASLRDMLVPLCVGGTLCVPATATRNDPLRLVAWLGEKKVTLVHCVPSLLRMMTREIEPARDGRDRLPDLALLLLAGEALYARDVQEWRARAGNNGQLVNLYGPTETTMIKTFHRIVAVPDNPAQVIPVGKPIANTQVDILNDEAPCRPGEIGEVYIKTPFWTKGYLNAAANAAVFVQNPLVKDRADLVYRTGDVGKFLKNGEIEVIGRVDEQVKINGIRIELDEIKGAVQRITGGEVLIITYRNSDLQTELVCYYCHPSLAEDALRERLEAEVNANVLPAFIVRLDAFPLNLNGKIDKRALPGPESLRSAGYGDDDQPVGEVERKLEAIWREILETSQAGRNVSFFKMGGNSLKAIRVLSRIYKEYGVMLTVGQMFGNPTIAKLALLLADSTRAACQAIVPAPPQAHYPLSSAERSVWIAGQAQESTYAFNIPLAQLLEGGLNQHALRSAFATLIGRHEILRTTFSVVEGEPRRTIHPAARYPVPVRYEDLQGTPDPYARAGAAAEREAVTGFDVAAGPLLRMVLLQLEPATHLLLLTMHHIITDGWSMNILLDELIVLYNAAVEGRTNPLQPLPIQYKDYAVWQAGQLQQQRQHGEFWRRQFRGGLPVLELPLDFSRPSLPDFAGRRTGMDLDAPDTARLHALSRQYDTTLFTVVLSSVYVLLYGYTGQKDMVIGAPVSGRTRQELEPQVGFYLNLLALRQTLQPDESFEAALLRVNTSLRQAYDHQAYPYLLLVEDLQAEQRAGRAGLFDVMVQQQDFQAGSITSNNPAGLAIKPFGSGILSSKYDLTFTYLEEGGKGSCWIEYKTALFEPRTLERMKQDWLGILRTVTENPAVSLRQLKSQLNQNAERVSRYQQFTGSDIVEEF